MPAARISECANAATTHGDVAAGMAIGETATIQRAAQRMVEGRVHGLPVTSASGKLVGFVSSTDVLAWLSGLR